MIKENKKILTNYLVEKKIESLFKQGEIKGSLHLSFGQEAVDVGVISALTNPLVFGNHRSHGQYLAATDDIEGLLRQLKNGMSQHLYSPSKFMSNGIQGGLTAAAVGSALAFKKQEIDRDVVCFIGDGTFGQGILYESLRLSSILNVNILFVVVRNKYSMSQTMEINLNEYSEVANAFQIPNFIVYNYKSIDVEFIQNLIKTHLGITTPKMLVADTRRLCGHSINDTQIYRDKEELTKEYLEEFCPIEYIKTKINKKEFTKLSNEINLRIEKAVQNVF